MKLKDLPDGYPINVDTETSGLYRDAGARIAAVSFSFRPPDGDWQPDWNQPMVWKAVAFDQGVRHLPLGEKDLDDKTAKRISKWPDEAFNEDAGNLSPERFVDLTEQLKRLKVTWHNAKFDQHMFDAGLRGLEAETGVNLEDQFEWDTQLAQSVIDPRFGTGLKPTSVRLHLGQELGVKEGMEDDEQQALAPWLGPKTGKNANPRFDLVPWSVMGPYAKMDAAMTLLLKEYQWDLCYEEYAFVVHHIAREFDLMKVLYRMERRGVRFDLDTAFQMETLIEAAKVETAAILPFRVTPVEARKYFFGKEEDGGLAHPVFSDKVTEKRGDPQVDDEVIERLAKENWEGQAVAKDYQRHESLKSANAKWYGAWPYMAGKDGRLRTNHRQAHVVSGRLAVERIQLQAIPHIYQMPKVDGLVSVRDLFYEDKMCPCGCGPMEMWEFDVSQAEIRIATAQAQCWPMLEGIRRGDDSHSIATRLMFAGQLDGQDNAHPEWDLYRGIAKRCNLGILYGIGVRTLTDQLKKFAGIDPPQTQVRGWIADWKAAFPEMEQRLFMMERRVVDLGYVRLINGRQRWFTPYEPAHKGFNQEIQGSLAEVMKVVMIDAENTWPDSLLLQIHDSLVMRFGKCQLEAGVADDVCALMCKTFEDAFTAQWTKEDGTKEWVTVPFKSDAKPFGRKVAA